MKKNLLILFLCAANCSLFAQDYLSGKLTDKNAKTTQIFYDRTENFVSKNVFQSVYKVFDKNKKLIYSVSLIHERAKSMIFVSVKPKGQSLTEDTVAYKKELSGLILSDKGNLDTAFNLSESYNYLLSFTDTSRDYPVVHKLFLHDKNSVSLDPLTKVRLKKQNQVVADVYAKNPSLRRNTLDKEAQEKFDNEMFNTQLARERDSLFARNALLAQHVEQMRTQITSDISVLFKTKKIDSDKQRYEGDKHQGEANGSGLFMSNGNYYDGYFKNGKFIDGSVIIHYDVYEYCGDYSSDSLNGLGMLKFKNESYRLGIFKDGTFYDGIVFSIEKSGEVFFGTSKRGERTGYGEFYNTKGEMYYGEFIDGHLVKGFTKDVDPFGYFTYSRIENGMKTPLDIQQGESFFNPLLTAKQ